MDGTLLAPSRGHECPAGHSCRPRFRSAARSLSAPTPPTPPRRCLSSFMYGMSTPGTASASTRARALFGCGCGYRPFYSQHVERSTRYLRYHTLNKVHALESPRIPLSTLRNTLRFVYRRAHRSSAPSPLPPGPCAWALALPRPGHTEGAIGRRGGAQPRHHKSSDPHFHLPATCQHPPRSVTPCMT